MINWDRALLKKPLSRAMHYHVSCPALLIWGMHDAYAEPALAVESVRLCFNGRIAYFDQSTHWVQHDEPDRAASILVDFLKA